MSCFTDKERVRLIPTQGSGEPKENAGGLWLPTRGSARTGKAGAPDAEERPEEERM